MFGTTEQSSLKFKQVLHDDASLKKYPKNLLICCIALLKKMRNQLTRFSYKEMKQIRLLNEKAARNLNPVKMMRK